MGRRTVGCCGCGREVVVPGGEEIEVAARSQSPEREKKKEAAMRRRRAEQGKGRKRNEGAATCNQKSRRSGERVAAAGPLLLVFYSSERFFLWSISTATAGHMFIHIHPIFQHHKLFFSCRAHCLWFHLLCFAFATCGRRYLVSPLGYCSTNVPFCSEKKKTNVPFFLTKVCKEAQNLYGRAIRN